MEELVEKHMYSVLHFVVLVLTSIVGAGAGAPDAANGGGNPDGSHREVYLDAVPSPGH